MREYRGIETADGKIVLEEVKKPGGSGEPLLLGPFGFTFAMFCIIGCILLMMFATGVFESIYFERNAERAASKISIEIVDKVEATETSRYNDGYVTAFEVKVINDSALSIVTITGELTVYNSANDVLDVADCTFNCYLDKKGETSFIVNLDRQSSDKVIELYASALEELSATFKITKITFEGYRSQTYDSDPVSVLKLSKDNGGVSSIEQSYQNAMSLFEQKRYSEALPLFASFGNYKESANKVSEILEIAEATAYECVISGDYSGACDILASYGYTAQNSDLYQAYAYASEGDFAAAIECGLTVIVIPDGVTSIEENAFAYCTTLTSITLPDSVTSIGKSAFYGCSGLTSINLPDRLTSIGEEAFAYCSNLTNIALPDSVTSIEDSAFCECDGLTSVAIGNGTVTIGEYVFQSCDNLTNVNIPNSITSIPEGMFTYCKSLENIAIPDSILSIGNYAFSHCGSLTSITLGKNVTSVGYESFSGCYGITSVVLSENFNRIGDKAFSDCSSLVDITFEGTQEEWDAVYKGYSWSSYTGEYTIHCTDGDITK